MYIFLLGQFEECGGLGLPFDGVAASYNECMELFEL